MRFRRIWQGLPTWAVAALITVVTLSLAGAVALATTPLGCNVSNRLGANTARCVATNLKSPQPTGVSTPTGNPSTSTPRPSATPVEQPSPTPTVRTTPSPPRNVPPYKFPSSPPNPPYRGSATGPLPSSVTLSCRLPVYTGQAGSGGFVVFPGRSFVADPRSAVSLPTPTPIPSPPGYGPQAGLSYDRQYRVWVPVAWNWVSPDGAHYAWPSPDSIYVRSLDGGALSELGEGHAWNIVNVALDGVYATQPNVPGLWFLAFSGTSRQVTATRWWQAVGGGAAYGTDTSAVPQGASNVIIRLDLGTGAAAPFFEWTGAQSQVMGFDAAGHPVIQTYSNKFGQRFWLVTAVGQATVIAGSGTFNPSGGPLADSHGIWFGGYQSIYLFVPGVGMYTAAAIGAQLAGPCA